MSGQSPKIKQSYVYYAIVRNIYDWLLC